MNVGERLKMLRELRQMTLDDVAKRIGITESTAQRYESGAVKTIPYERIGALANVFGCDPGFIMGWQKELVLLDTKSDEIKEIVAIYEMLPPEERAHLAEYAKYLAQKK